MEMENQAIDAQQSDSEEDVKVGSDGSHQHSPQCMVDNGLTAQRQLSSRLCSESSVLLEQTDDKQAKHQQCSTTTTADRVENVPDRAADASKTSANSFNTNELLDPDKMGQLKQCFIDSTHHQVSNRGQLENSQNLKSTTDQAPHSYHTDDQLLTVAINDNFQMLTETAGTNDQLQSVEAAVDNQLIERPNWPAAESGDDDCTSVVSKSAELSANKPNSNISSVVHVQSHSPLVRMQHQQIPVDQPIEHQLLQSASTVSSASQVFNRKNYQFLHQRHLLEPQTQTGDERLDDSTNFLNSSQEWSVTSVATTAVADADLDVDAATATAEEVVASNSSASVPPCDYHLPTSEQSALFSLPLPPIASLTSSSFPTTTSTSTISSITTTTKNDDKSPSSPLSLRTTGAHQPRGDITGSETSIEHQLLRQQQQHDQHQLHQHDINSCQKTQRCQPVRTVDKKLTKDRAAKHKSSSKGLEKLYPLTTFTTTTSDREPSISFLASYPPQTAQTELNSSSQQHQLGASSIDSFSEHTPLLGATHSKLASKKQQSSSTSLSSSTLSLFLESLKVNSGGSKSNAGKRSLKSKPLVDTTTTTQFKNPLAYQHPLVDVHDSPPPIDHHLSFPMSTQSNSSLGSIPMRAVTTLVSSSTAEKMTLNNRAALMTSNTNLVTKANGHSNGGSTTSQSISTPQQRYLASLLDDGSNEASTTTTTAGTSFQNLPSSSKQGQGEVGVPQQQLSFQPYPNPKSSTAPAVAMPMPPNLISVRSNGGQSTGQHCNHRITHHQRCYVSSGSYDGGATTGLTTTDDDTCSMSTSTSKHEESFSLKFPKLRYVKVALLAGLIIYTLISFIAIQEKEDKWTNVAAQEGIPAYVDLSHSLDLMFPVWKLRARGSFLPAEYGKLTNYSIVFTVVQLLNDSQGADRNGAYRLVKGPWAAPITPPKLAQYMNTEVEHVFKLTRGDAYDHIHRYQLRIDTNSEESVGITVNMAGFSELSADGIILATTVLVFLYTLIIFEIVNRTLAAMLGATAAITCLTLIRDRPSLEKVVSWLDVETLCLLFGMMVLVAILCETGFFDYIAVVAFRLAKGRTWPLIFTLCFFTGILSAFLDNVTTILLMTPVTIRLCEIKNIDPKLVLIAQVMFSNIGGAATPVGDPPNVIIISSLKIQKQGVDFGRFTLHMMPGILLSFAATLLYIRFAYRSLSSKDFEEGNSSDIENTPPSKANAATVSYQYSVPLGVVASTAETGGNNHPRSHSEPQFSRQPGTSSSVGVPNSTSRRPGARIASVSPTNQLESSSEFDGYSYGHTHNGRNSRILRSSSGHHGKDALDQCLSCNSMDDFCAGTSVRDSILDERRVFRSSDELKREIEVWKRATNSISGYSRDENSVRNVLNRKVEILETVLQEHCYETVPPEDNYHSVLAELEEKYKIRDYPLLYKSGIVMTLVISLFFMQSIPNLDLSLGWIAILGAILLLVLADRHEMESIISRVEWSTLIFFAALFVVMEALAELKFLWWIGRLTQDFINSVPEAQRLVVAILLFTWISAFASSFIDNIPLTTVMVKILEDLSENNEFNIPLVPLIYALAFGACLGGNGTLIGASSNVVCAGVAEQHGYRFTFMDFFKVGFPIMLLTVGISSVYLVVCHVIFDWNY